MSTRDSALTAKLETQQRFAKDFSELWRRSVRNVLLGTLVSVLPAFVFYSVAFSYSHRQLFLTARLFPLPLLAAFAVDLSFNWRYLGPYRRLSEGEITTELLLRAYRRLHNFPLFSFARVFGPHAFVASTVAQIAVLFANARWGLGIPSRHFWVYWLLNLTLVPIGHAVFEYHLNGRAVRRALTRVVSEAPEGTTFPGVWRVGLAKRLAVFYTLLAVSPLVLLAAAVRVRSLSSGASSVGSSDVGLVIAGVTGLNLLLLLLLAVDVSDQTRTLLTNLNQVEEGDLEARVDLFSPDEFGVISEGVNKMIRGLRDRERLRDLFGVYVSPEVLKAILEGKVDLEGETREVSVMFCDIRDFTQFSSTRPPRQVVNRLNRFFARMAGAITAQGGTINKFLGDGFLAVFGAPVHHRDHARRAIEAALQMEAELEAFNQELREQEEPLIEIGIGIDTGEVVAGNVGARDRLEYTVIGDPVNRSSRVEQLNKTCETRILITERTRRHAGLSIGRSLPPVTVKGIDEPLQVFAVGRKA